MDNCNIEKVYACVDVARLEIINLLAVAEGELDIPEDDINELKQRMANAQTLIREACLELSELLNQINKHIKRK
jgi:tRNA U34 5-carboxymethylaminomethyl modifying GTPase MnmE/TrmE